MRPQIKPGLRRVWRDEGTVQIGLHPDTGVLVAGLEPGEASLIERLDGTHPTSELASWASGKGVSGARVRALLHLLEQAGVLTGAPTDRAHLHELGPAERDRLGPDALAWSVTYPDAGDGFELLADRARRQVQIVGRGRLATAVRDAVTRLGVAAQHRDRLPVPLLPTQLVVLVGVDEVSTSAGAVLLGAGVAHLAVVGGTDRASVGPLVVPGRSACLRCLDLHRTDRDPAWPTVAAQLGRPPDTARGESSLTVLAAALASLQVACWLDRRRAPASVGATLSVTLPDGLSTRHAWPVHPACGCSWLSASLPAALPTDGAGLDR